MQIHFLFFFSTNYLQKKKSTSKQPEEVKIKDWTISVSIPKNTITHTRAFAQTVMDGLLLNGPIDRAQTGSFPTKYWSSAAVLSLQQNDTGRD